MDVDADITQFHSIDDCPNVDDMEDDSGRYEYINDVFEGSARIKWKYDVANCLSVTIDEVDREMLTMAKSVVASSTAKCESLCGRREDLKAHHTAGIFLNRDFYLMLKDAINAGLDRQEDWATVSEVHEMIRVWLLQMIYQTTSTKLFDSKASSDKWFYQASGLKISERRYNELFKGLGLNSRTYEIQDIAEDGENWGTFEQYNPTVCDLENHVAKVGENFVCAGLDMTINDDKLRHSSRKFRDHGLQMTGFRGSRIGPVMNGLGIVSSGVIVSIHFSRHKDSPASVVQSLFRNIRYGQDNTLRHQLDCRVMIDRGYQAKKKQRYS